MKKGQITGQIFVILSLFVIIPLASAAISFSNPAALYNLGDEIKVSVSVSSQQAVNDFLSIDLVCPESSIELYKSPIKLVSGDQRVIAFSTSFDRTLTNGMTGQCYFKADYGQETSESRKFDISSDISTTIENFYSLINPASNLNITGTAVKKNGMRLEGIALLSIPDISVNSAVDVKNGQFTFNFAVPANAKAKEYLLEIKVYDKDTNNEILNRGNSSSSFKVKQILSRIDLAFDSTSITPGNNITYAALALDQAGDNMNAEIKAIITSPLGKFDEKALSTSQSYTINTFLNTTPGVWSINVNSGNINNSKSFAVQEYPKLSFLLSGNIVTIENIGNIVYKNPISIKIGENSFIDDTDLQVGESMQRRLDAPDGEYVISVSANGEESQLGSTLLTGKVIGINDPNKINWTNLIPWIWVVLILALGMAAFFYYKKLAKPSSFSSTPSSNARKINVLTPVSSSKASIMEYGQRRKCSVVAIKINNFDSVKNNQVVKETISKISDLAKKRRGYTEKYQSGYIFIFAPILTKEEENALTAVEFAKDVHREIEDHNKRFATAIDFGIGINEGELAIEYRGGIFNYTSTGNTIALARKIAEGRGKSVYLSDQVHASTRSKVKVERKAEGWKVTSISDSSKYSDFISRFKQRNY